MVLKMGSVVNFSTMEKLIGLRDCKYIIDIKSLIEWRNTSQMSNVDYSIEHDLCYRLSYSSL